MRYPEEFIGPMRQELTCLGVQELRSSLDVDDFLINNPDKGVLMIVINSMCGCAAGRARPGVALALQHSTLPVKVATVFAGGDLEATARVREYLKDYQVEESLMKQVLELNTKYSSIVEEGEEISRNINWKLDTFCLLYTSDAADE